MVITNRVQFQKSKEKCKTGAEQIQTSEKNLKVGSGTMEEKVITADRSRPPCSFFVRNQENEIIRRQLGDQHAT